MAETAAVVVNYNGGTWLARCLESLRAQQPPFTDIVVVDNDSRDGSADDLPDGVRLLRRPRNDGFGAGVRDGLATTTAPVVMVLNADIELEAGCLAAAQAALESDPELGSVSPWVLQDADPSRIDATGIGLTSFLGQINWDHGRPLEDLPTEPQDVLGPLGGASLWRRTALERVGGIRAGYFLYWEDMDLALRLQHAGFGCRTAPDARVRHGGGASVGHMSGRNVFYMARNHWSCLLACLPGPVLRRSLLAWMAAPVRAAILYALRGHPFAALAGLLCGLLRLPGALAQRRRRVGDDAEAAARIERLMAAADANRLVTKALATP